MRRPRISLCRIASGAAPGLLLLACAGSPEPEALQWHAVDPGRDTIPYIVDEVDARATAEPGAASAGPPAGPTLMAANSGSASPVTASAQAGRPTVAEVPPGPPAAPPGGTASAPAPTAAPGTGAPVPAGAGEGSQRLEIPAPLETATAAASSPVEDAPARRTTPVPGEIVADAEEPRALPLPEEPAHSAEEMSDAHLVPTGDEEPLEIVRDPGLDEPTPAPAPAGPAETAPAPSASLEAPALSPAEPGTTEPDAMEPLLPETWNDSVVARVNGAPILFSELKEFAIEENLPLTGLTADGARGDAFRKAMTARVDQTLLIQAANLESLEPDPLEVARRVDAFIAQRIDEAGGRAEFIQTLRGAQLSLESFREMLMKRESRRQLASGIVARRVTISSAELEAFKRRRREAGEPLEEVQLAQILVACPVTDQDTEFGREQYRRALEIATRAGRQPAAFSKIVADINTDPTGRERGGLLGWVDPAKLQPAIAGAVAKMRHGEVSEPVASDSGFHVLFVVDRRDARDMLYARKFEEERNRLIEELRGKAQIEIYPVEGAG